MTDDEADARAEEFIRILPPDVVQDIANRLVDEGFRDEGFLSPMSTALIPDVMKDEQEWFDLALKLNRFSQKIWGETEIEGKRDDPKPLAVRLLAKGNRAFQASILLAQRGMCAESETMSRTCLEIAFWLGYLTESPDEAVQCLLADEWKNGGERAKQFADMLEDEAAAPFREAAAVCAANYAVNKDTLSPKTLAKRAGMDSIYPYYKALCGISAHPSIASLDRFLEVDSEGLLTFKSGPDYDQVTFSLMTAITVQLWALERYAIIQDWPEDDQTFNDLRAERDAIMMRDRPDSD